MVSTSRSRGTLRTTCSPGTRIVAARIGRAAFFAPLTRTLPCRREPPAIVMLSMALGRPPRGDDALDSGQVAPRRFRDVVSGAREELPDPRGLPRPDLEQQPGSRPQQRQGTGDDPLDQGEAVGSP